MECQFPFPYLRLEVRLRPAVGGSISKSNPNYISRTLRTGRVRDEALSIAEWPQHQIQIMLWRLLILFPQTGTSLRCPGGRCPPAPAVVANKRPVAVYVC